MSDFTICPTAFSRGKKKLYKEHIVHCKGIQIVLPSLTINMGCHQKVPLKATFCIFSIANAERGEALEETS